MNRDKRKYEKIYYEINMDNQFERLLGWYEERTQKMIESNDNLKLVFYVRRVFFNIYDRENEYAFYLMRLAKLFRKKSKNAMHVNRLFKECAKF